MHRTCINANTESHWKMVNGYWQAPVVMVKEGVMCGSDGCLLWPASTIEAMAQKWHDIPVSLGHPQIDGRPVSINASPEVFATHAIGYVQNPHYDPNTRSLKAMIKIPQGVRGINQIQQLREVSIGVFTNNVNDNGNHQGREYFGYVSQAHPDHLALLQQDEVGACSWEGGCGVRTHAAFTEAERQEMLAVFVEAFGNHLQEIHQGIGGTIMSDDHAYYPICVNEEDSEIILDEWEGFEGLVPPEVDALRMKRDRERMAETGTTNDDPNDDDNLLLPPGVK